MFVTAKKPLLVPASPGGGAVTGLQRASYGQHTSDHKAKKARIDAPESSQPRRKKARIVHFAQ